MAFQAWLNRCAFTPTAYSNTDNFEVNVSAPVVGMYRPSQTANPIPADQATYHYFAQSADLTQHEEGDAVWDDASSTLMRQSGTVRNSSDGPATFVNFSAAPNVFMGGSDSTDMLRASEYTLQAVGVGLTGTLNFTGDPVIRYINLTENNLSEVYATGCYNLQQLILTNNSSLSVVNVVGCTSLNRLALSSYNSDPIDNPLDLTTCGGLIYFSNPNGNSSGVILPPAPGVLSIVDLSSSGLDNTYDLTPYTELSYLNISGNAYTSIDFTAFNLSYLNIAFCEFTSIDLSTCSSLSVLDVSSNSLNALDLTLAVFLSSLTANDCGGTMTTIVLPSSTSFFQTLIARSSGLTSIDLGGGDALVTIDLDLNSLTSLDVSNHNQLLTLTATNNGMTTLSLGGHGVLTHVNVDTNALTTIDVSSCPQLINLLVNGSALTEAAVDGVLAALVNQRKFFGLVNMADGTSSPPSAAGLVDKAKLEDRGWTVFVN